MNSGRKAVLHLQLKLKSSIITKTKVKDIYASVACFPPSNTVTIKCRTLIMNCEIWLNFVFPSLGMCLHLVVIMTFSCYNDSKRTTSDAALWFSIILSYNLKLQFIN